MSTEPLKKELESIDLELELAMAQLSETTQRVDDLLADFSADNPPAARERKPPLVLHAVEESADSDTESDEESAEEEVDDAGGEG